MVVDPDGGKMPGPAPSVDPRTAYAGYSTQKLVHAQQVPAAAAAAAGGGWDSEQQKQAPAPTASPWPGALTLPPPPPYNTRPPTPPDLPPPPPPANQPPPGYTQPHQPAPAAMAPCVAAATPAEAAEAAGALANPFLRAAGGQPPPSVPAFLPVAGASAVAAAAAAAPNPFDSEKPFVIRALTMQVPRLTGPPHQPHGPLRCGCSQNPAAANRDRCRGPLRLCRGPLHWRHAAKWGGRPVCR